MLKVTSQAAQRVTQVAQTRSRRRTQMSPGQQYQRSKSQWEQFFGNPLSGAEQNLEQLTQWTNTTSLPAKNRGKCAICGSNIPEGQGVIDERGVAGAGANALLCPQDAQRLGISALDVAANA